MPVDPDCLRADYRVKVGIIEDVVDIVEVLERKPTAQLADMFEYKLQEYYLERHYGGSTEVAELGISERDEESLG